MFRILACMSVILFGQSAFAAQYIQMDQTTVIPVNVSLRTHNRIGISGDRIKKAFFKGTNVSVEVEEETGQLFVQAIRPNCPVTTLSIVSMAGEVQDLDLCFQDISSEIVILQQRGIPEIEGKSIGIETVACETVEQSSLTTLIDGIIQGIIPEGYASIEDQDKPQKICEGLKIQRISRLVSNDQIIFIYHLQNTSCKTKLVTECQVNVIDGDWVFLDRNKLRPEECAVVLIGCMR